MIAVTPCHYNVAHKFNRFVSHTIVLHTHRGSLLRNTWWRTDLHVTSNRRRSTVSFVTF